MKHDINGYKNGCRCAECTYANKLRNRARREKQLRFPVEPLIEHLPPEFASNHKDAIKAWATKGLTVFEVDRMCTKYGVHPYSVYGTYWHSDMWASVA
jgi:hypothetical protein